MSEKKGVVMDELLDRIEFELREYENTCYQRVQREYGKIEGADFILQTIRAIEKERSQDVDSDSSQ